MSARKIPISFYPDGNALRSRSVSTLVLSGAIDVPPPPARLVADWQRDIASQLCLDLGDVEPLSLARSRARWPDLQRCVQSMADWTTAQGLPSVLAKSEMALMACRGARYHHDGLLYGGHVFCNLFLSADQGLDVHFPDLGLRIPLACGTALVFDTCQPHAVIPRGSSGFDARDFSSKPSCDQVFLTWELPVDDGHVAGRLGIEFDIDRAMATRLTEAQVQMDGVAVRVCPASGVWHAEPRAFHGDPYPRIGGKLHSLGRRRTRQRHGLG